MQVNTNLLHFDIYPACRTGDITTLTIEAIVNPTNETLSDKNPISNRIFEVAGPELKDECQNQIGSMCYC